MLMPDKARRYLQKYGVKGPWELVGAERRDFAAAVVIPSLAEGDSLFRTLDSLANNPENVYKDVLVLIVVNHGQEAAKEDVLQNQADLARLADYAYDSLLNLAWIDAASPGLAIPKKQAGVGFARKLGLDAVLPVLDWSTEPLLICLDADTLVEENYLQTIQNHFRQSSLGAVVLPYRHQQGETPEQQAAIERYEVFLRSYVYGLRLAGSPYAFNSVGSAMACRSSAYVRCGGMNTRKAGEDFYFLQKLAKTDGVARLAGTTVMPAPRISRRVPFGTGRSMERMLEDDYRGVLIYPFEAFYILGQWLKLVESNHFLDAESILASAVEVSPVLSDYLQNAGWRKTWSAIQENHRTGEARLQAFHVWFDGFKSLRLIHMLCEKHHQRDEPDTLLPEYFAYERTECPQTMKGMLEKLRIDDEVAFDKQSKI